MQGSSRRCSPSCCLLGSAAGLSTILLLLALSLPAGLLYRVRGGWLDLPSAPFGQDLTRQLAFGCGLALLAFFFGPSCNGSPKKAIALLFFSLALAVWSTLGLPTSSPYSALGRQSAAPAQVEAGVFDWALGSNRTTSGNSEDQQWLRDATGLSLTGLQASVLPGFILFLLAAFFISPAQSLHPSSRRWLILAALSYLLSGAAMFAIYQLGWSLKGFALPSLPSNSFVEGLPLAELLWGCYVAIAVLLPLAVLASLPEMASASPFPPSKARLLGALPCGGLLLLLTWPCRRAACCSCCRGEADEDGSSYGDPSAVGEEEVFCPCFPVLLEDDDDAEAVALREQEHLTAAADAADPAEGRRSRCWPFSASSASSRDLRSLSIPLAAADGLVERKRRGSNSAALANALASSSSRGSIFYGAVTGDEEGRADNAADSERTSSLARNRCCPSCSSHHCFTCTCTALLNAFLSLFAVFIALSAVWWSRHSPANSNSSNDSFSLLSLWSVAAAVLVLQLWYWLSVCLVRRTARAEGISRLEARNELLLRSCPSWLLCACVPLADEHDSTDGTGCLSRLCCSGDGICCLGAPRNTRFVCRCGQAAAAIGASQTAILDDAAFTAAAAAAAGGFAALAAVVPHSSSSIAGSFSAAAASSSSFSALSDRTRSRSRGDRHRGAASFTTAVSATVRGTSSSFVTAQGGAVRTKSLFSSSATTTNGNFLEAADAALETAGVGKAGFLSRYESVGPVNGGRYPSSRGASFAVPLSPQPPARTSFAIGHGTRNDEDDQGGQGQRGCGSLLSCCRGGDEGAGRRGLLPSSSTVIAVDAAANEREGCLRCLARYFCFLCLPSESRESCFSVFLLYSHRWLRLLFALQMACHCLVVLATVAAVIFSVVRGYSASDGPGGTSRPSGSYWPW